MADSDSGLLIRGSWRRVAALVSGFAALQAIFTWLHPGPRAMGSVYWWGWIAEVMRARGYFNVWTPYPPVFPALAYGGWLAAGGPQTFELMWMALNGVCILLMCGLIYGLLRDEVGREHATLAAFGFFLINNSWQSGMLIGLQLDQSEYLALALLVAALALLARGRICASAICCALGAMTKLFPALLVPAAMIHLGRRGAARYVVVFLIICGALAAPGFLANRDIFLSTYRWNAARGPWESVYSYPHVTRPPVPGSIETITTAVAPQRSPWSLLLIPTVACGAAALVLLRRALDDRAGLWRMTLLLVLILLIFSRGVSSYYVLWLFPLVFLVYDWRAAFAICAGLLVLSNIEVLSIKWFGEMPEAVTAHWISVFARHAVFVGLAVHQVRRLARRRARLRISDCGLRNVGEEENGRSEEGNTASQR